MRFAEAGLCQSERMVAVRIVVAFIGIGIVLWTLASAVKTVVLPRATSSILTRTVFISIAHVFDLIAPRSKPFARRDRVHALYAPTALLVLPAVWVALVIAGFTAIYWGMGVNPLSEAFIISGSSMLTLGFDRPTGLTRTTAAFIQAGIGLGLVTLMISYLPSIYGAFSRREALVGMLEGRAGIPPSPTELLVRYWRIGLLHRLHDDVYAPWEQWFVDVEETHTSQPALPFFKSPHPERSWITAAGCVLDAAAITVSTLDRPRDARAEVMMRTGWFCLRRICDFYAIPYDPDP